MTRRRLRDDEKALWARITETVEPLRPLPVPPPPPPPPPVEPPAPPVAVANGMPLPPKKPAKRTPAPGDIDWQTRRKIARGAVAIDGRIDLHGMTQDEAHAALLRFVEASAAMKRRVVLVITGKGDGSGEGRGVLRRSVPHWLAGREVSRLVVSFGPAHASHGGDGALYVRLRRR